MPELEIYSLIGSEGFARLVAAFYRSSRDIRQDLIVLAMHDPDWQARNTSTPHRQIASA
ncbi:MAG: hypothetical protein WBV36_07650 [Terriglobales bacterium]